MRTKALLLAAVFGVAGLATSFAQVYSVNAVGYVNVTLSEGYNLIANPLQATSMTIGDLINPSVVVNNMAAFKFNNTSQQYQIANYDMDIFGGWDDPAAFTLAPGEGMFVLVPAGAGQRVNTFVGEVMQGTLSNALTGGIGKFNMVSSMVPQTGGLVTDLGYPVSNGDTIFLYDPDTGYANGTFNYDLDIFGGWDTGVEPTVAVGQAFFALTGANKTWTRNFSVN